ncbi:hypothetical protein ILUMI_18034 [Ignelater luminosus]|uniref:Uncharacterized protein n=1 Tax=Ignelater luminosus TaxID=2038154 RepID=A0A8K0CKN3_IGNLU|nr:hypothetical protein ILUMI_18034 [Ignelater luminosus]
MITMETSSDEASSVASSMKQRRELVSMFHTYSLSPMHYRMQIMKEKSRIRHYKRKLKNVTRTTKRLQAKVEKLCEVIKRLKKKNRSSTCVHAVNCKCILK